MCRRGLPVVVLAVVAGLVSAPGAASQAGTNPLEGVPLFVDHESPSWHQWEAYRRSGQRRKAALTWKIAREPKALWVGRYTPNPLVPEIRRHIRLSRRTGSLPIFTVLRAISDECNASYTAGGR